MSSKHLPVRAIYEPPNTSEYKMEEDDSKPETPNGSDDSSEDDVKKTREAKKPTKTTRKQRTQRYIMKLKEDSPDLILSDILAENKRLRREIEALRVQNTSLKREHEELTHALLSDRLKNQYPDLEF